MGIVSNGLASAVLVFSGLSGTWTDWPGYAQAVMWLSAAITFAIALALTLTYAWRRV
jgi:hypothetical protein